MGCFWQSKIARMIWIIKLNPISISSLFSFVSLITTFSIIYFFLLVWKVCLCSVTGVIFERSTPENESKMSICSFTFGINCGNSYAYVCRLLSIENIRIRESNSIFFFHSCKTLYFAFLDGFPFCLISAALLQMHEWRTPTSSTKIHSKWLLTGPACYSLKIIHISFDRCSQLNF